MTGARPSGHGSHRRAVASVVGGMTDDRRRGVVAGGRAEAAR
jgi:hypothetical protein